MHHSGMEKEIMEIILPSPSPTEARKCPLEEIPVGKGRKLKEGSDLAVITIGPIGNVLFELYFRLRERRQ